MHDIDLSRLPIEKEYSENINRSMQVPSSITLASSGGSSSDSESRRRSGARTNSTLELMKAPKVISPFGAEEEAEIEPRSFSPARESYRHKRTAHTGRSDPWAHLPATYEFDNLEMKAPARRIRADSRDDEGTPQRPTIRGIYSSNFEAMTMASEELSDLNEQLLKDLDKTAENEKLRKQIFKINRKLLTHEKQMAAMQQKLTLFAAIFGSVCLGALMYQLRRP